MWPPEEFVLTARFAEYSEGGIEYAKDLVNKKNLVRQFVASHVPSCVTESDVSRAKDGGGVQRLSGDVEGPHAKALDS